jgi:hypothetical protein
MVRIKNNLRSFKNGMGLFGSCITFFINSLLLSFVYFFGFGLTSIISKIFGKSFIDKSIDKNKESYWVDLNLSTQKLNEYYRQF